MYLRRWYRQINGQRKAYWALVESQRTERGPRQHVVAYLGDMDDAGRLGMTQAASGEPVNAQGRLFDQVEPRWVEVDVRRLRVERVRDFGGPWLGLQLIRQLKLESWLGGVLPAGREEVGWPVMSLVLVLSRFCDPSSELHIAEHFYEQSALADLLGVPVEKVNEDRLYRTLDRLLPHKADLEKHLAGRLGELFDLDYDLLLYDVTSTYFEGEAAGNPLARRGYSRDHRPDCKQVCIAMVVSRCGMPLGYEVFAGNRADVTTVEQIVETMESRYGKANRIWAMDRGMVSQDNIAFMQAGGRRYIVGTPKGMLKQYEQQLLGDDWESIREGLEVKQVPSPEGDETFILCRSAQRREKEKAMHERFAKRIEQGLERIANGCQKRKQKVAVIERRVGRLLGQNTRAEGLFKVEVTEDERGAAVLNWSRDPTWRDWAMLSEGCYLLRSNVTDWSAEDLWHAYMQLTEAESAFRIHKSDLRLRPIWHQKPERVQAHILVCFLAYVLWKTLAQCCHRAGLGDEPRKVIAELVQIKLVDVVLPVRGGPPIRRRCVSRPTDHQAILLHRLGLHLPAALEIEDDVVRTLG
jgi:transposase